MEILVDILKAVANGNEKPTHIMYKANLSWTRLKDQLNFLIKQDMLIEEEHESGTVYRMTPKGKEIIEYFKKIESVLTTKRGLVPLEVYASYK